MTKALDCQALRTGAKFLVTQVSFVVNWAPIENSCYSTIVCVGGWICSNPRFPPKNLVQFLQGHSFPTPGKDLGTFLLRFFDLIIHQEVPKLFFQQKLRGLVDKTTDQQPKVQQIESDRRQGLGLKNFLLIFVDSHNSLGSSKVKIILSYKNFVV